MQGEDVIEPVTVDVLENTRSRRFLFVRDSTANGRSEGRTGCPYRFQKLRCGCNQEVVEIREKQSAEDFEVPLTETT
jgi:hypothetical protein